MIDATAERGTLEIKLYSKEEKIRQVADREAWIEWSRSMPQGELQPDTVPDTRYHRRWYVAAFRTVIPMP